MNIETLALHIELIIQDAIIEVMQGDGTLTSKMVTTKQKDKVMKLIKEYASFSYIQGMHVGLGTGWDITKFKR